jgi:GntR family transcriptional regulator
MVVRVSPVPLYIQIEEELRGSIQSGELVTLGQVPSEADLAEKFGVSRMTARKALDRLVGDGLIFRQPGKGTFVAPPKISHSPSQSLSFSAAMRAQGISFETRVLEVGLVKASTIIAAALSLPADGAVVFLRRLRLVEGEPGALHTSYLPARYSLLLEADLTGSLSELMARVGARIASTRDTIEAVIARGDEARTLGVSVGSPAILIQGVAYAASMEPLRYTEALYRGDRWRFSLDTTLPIADFRPEPKAEERTTGQFKADRPHSRSLFSHRGVKAIGKAG